MLRLVEHVALNLARLDRLADLLDDVVVKVDLLRGAGLDKVAVEFGGATQVLARRFRLEVVAEGVDTLPEEEILDAELHVQEEDKDTSKHCAVVMETVNRKISRFYHRDELDEVCRHDSSKLSLP